MLKGRWLRLHSSVFAFVDTTIRIYIIIHLMFKICIWYCGSKGHCFVYEIIVSVLCLSLNYSIIYTYYTK